MTSLDNHAAATNLCVLLTPAGAGAIAVVRIVGPDVERFLSRHFAGHPDSGRCAYGLLRDASNAVLDDIVVVLSGDGRSADLNLHAGPWVVASVLQLLARLGFALFDEAPLETIDGADALEREMLAALPLARTELGLRMLLKQPAAWREFMASNPSGDERASVAADRCLWRMLHPARVAIVGLPNVGKSTLANQLFGQQRSITADIPGTTRDWIGALAEVGGVPITLIDTPGLRDSADAIEQSAIALARAVAAQADLTLFVLDPTQPRAPQRELIAAHTEPARRLLIVNKSDLASWSDAVDIQTVATTGAGIERVRQLIRMRLGCADLDPHKPRWWSERQRIRLATGTTDRASNPGDTPRRA